MKKIFLLLLCSILLIVGCGKKETNIKRLAKQMIDTVEAYLDLKIDINEAYDKSNIIDNRAQAFVQKMSMDEDVAGYTKNIRLSNCMSQVNASLYGIRFNYDSNNELIDNLEKLKDMI